MSSAPIQGGPAPLHGNPAPVLHQPAAQLQPNPNPMPVPVPVPVPEAPTVPRLVTVDVAEDPRGTKRAREGDEIESDRPVIKCARTSPEEAEVNLNQWVLFSAISNGDHAQVEKLLRQSPALRDSLYHDDDGLTPLCLAAQRGHLEIMGLLLRLGAPINAAARNGYTPLMLAAQNGHADMVRKLCLLGADRNVINQMNGKTALCFAATNKHFEPAKQLIVFGARVNDVAIKETGEKEVEVRTPLSYVVEHDFAELVAWMIDSGNISVNCIEGSTKLRLLYLAVKFGALDLVRLLIERGAMQDVLAPYTDSNVILMNVWDVAAFFSRSDVVEHLLSLELRPPKCGVWDMDSRDTFEFSVVKDVMGHLSKADDPEVPADKLDDPLYRLKPWLAIEQLARLKSTSPKKTIGMIELSSLGLFGWLNVAFTHDGGLKKLSIGAYLLGARSFKTDPSYSARGLTTAQMTQRLVEHLSVTLCSDEYTNPFSGLKLTPQGEQRMNRIAEAQRVLLLKAITYLREQFAQRVSTLPSVSMSTYVTLARELNEADLYRKLTREWGLYDPIARAAVRLVKEAWHKLRDLPPESMSAEFANLTQAEQLRHLMVSLLEEWDKIPEIVETFRNSSADELEIVSDLLFQQWRLFGEAFGVTKERDVRIGPVRPQTVEAAPLMEVDEVAAVKPSSFLAHLPQH